MALVDEIYRSPIVRGVESVGSLFSTVFGEMLGNQGAIKNARVPLDERYRERWIARNLEQSTGFSPYLGEVEVIGVEATAVSSVDHAPTTLQPDVVIDFRVTTGAEQAAQAAVPRQPASR